MSNSLDDIRKGGAKCRVSAAAATVVCDGDIDDDDDDSFQRPRERKAVFLATVVVDDKAAA